jgi:hypothetical protein
MFIVREPKKNRLKPRRGDMGPLGACHAASTGLKTVVGVRGGYKHVAPPELEPCRIREREVAGANKSAAGKGGIRVLFQTGRACPALPERYRWAGFCGRLAYWAGCGRSQNENCRGFSFASRAGRDTVAAWRVCSAAST